MQDATPFVLNVRERLNNGPTEAKRKEVQPEASLIELLCANNLYKQIDSCEEYSQAECKVGYMD
ncbi:MAG: hypothetical protein NMNS02_29620 [Nitrosomonas sp.]|nr:MAG: hypothetical protein NMNS02_29620 [Nitrosomonas sp.]